VVVICPREEARPEGGEKRFPWTSREGSRTQVRRGSKNMEAFLQRKFKFIELGCSF